MIPTPTSWTDTGLDWSAADPLWPLELTIPCLRESVKECYSMLKVAASAYNWPLPSVVSSAYNPLNIRNDVDAIHQCVSYFLEPPYNPPFTTGHGYGADFINHDLDASGYEGVSLGSWPLPLNFWNNVSALAKIGDASRIIPGKLDVLSPWIFQTYKLLNLFRWSNLPKTNNNTNYEIDFTWPVGAIPVCIYNTHSGDSVLHQTFSGNITFSGTTFIWGPMTGYATSGANARSILKFNNRKFRDW